MLKRCVYVWIASTNPPLRHQLLLLPVVQEREQTIQPEEAARSEVDHPLWRTGLLRSPNSEPKVEIGRRGLTNPTECSGLELEEAEMHIDRTPRRCGINLHLVRGLAAFSPSVMERVHCELADFVDEVIAALPTT